MDRDSKSEKKTKIGRNDPCPCGSGMKYKKCCLVRQSTKNNRQIRMSPGFSEKMSRRHQDHLRREKLREQTYGKVRPIIHMDFKGYKFVAVGNQLHYSKSWKTFPDFLMTYITAVLGRDWGNSELSKPYEERHQIVKWYDGAVLFFSQGEKDEEGICSGIPDGLTAAYLRLAYDLYILRHHTALQNEVVRRLKHPEQFQGARYELFAAATCIRAGFDIAYEDERDRTSTHPEFVATHKQTREIISVEAKSRHRPGVLGFPGELEPESEIKVKVRRLLNKALSKSTNHPYVIFIDLNLPPSPPITPETPWFREIRNGISEDGAPEKENPDPYNLLVFTNHAEQYGKKDETYPSPQTIFVIPKYSRVTVRNPQIISELHHAASQYGNIPNLFPKDWRSEDFADF
jgi:uncharacterized protein YchJ